MDDDLFGFLCQEDAPALAGSVCIRVSSIVGDVLLEAELPLAETVVGVKARVCEVTGTPAGEQQLVLLVGGTSPLQDGDILGNFVDEPGAVLEVSMVRIERHLAISWSGDRSLRLWDITTGAVLHDFGGHRSSSVPLGVEVDPSWSRALSWGGAMTMRLWDLQHGICLRSLYDNTSMKVFSMHVDWPRERALSWGSERWLQLWDLETSACTELRGHADCVRGVQTSWDRGRAVTWGTSDAILWSLDEGTPLYSLRELWDVCVLSVDTSWGRAMLGSSGGSLHLWDWELSGALVAVEMPGRIAAVPKALVDWELTRGLSWDAEAGILCLWNELGVCQEQLVPGILEVQVDWVRDRAVSWSIDQRLLQPQLWDLGRTSTSLRLRCRGTMSPCGEPPEARIRVDWARQRALSWGRNCLAIRLWELAHGTVVHELQGHSAGVQGVLADWGLDRALSWAGDASLRLWDLEKGTLVRKMQREPVGSFGVQVDWAQNCVLTWTMHRCFSNDSSYVLEFWDLDRSEPARVLVGHTDVVKGAAMASEQARSSHSRASPIVSPCPLPDGRLGGRAGTSTGARLLADYAAGRLDRLVAEYHEQLRGMVHGLPLRGQPSGAPRASGEALPGGDVYLPVEDARGRVRIIMYGTASTLGAPRAQSAPFCLAIALRNSATAVIENAGWFGLTAMALARPHDFPTSYGALPLPRPSECACEYACVMLGTNDAMAVAGSDAFVHVNYVEPKTAPDFPRLPPDWKTRCRPSPELYERSVRLVVQELMAAGTRVAIATPPPLGEQLEDAPVMDRHVQRSAFRVVSELAAAVWHVAASEGCDVLPFFECCMQRLRQLQGAGWQPTPWTPRTMFEFQREAVVSQEAQPPRSWDEVLPEPRRLAFCYDMVHMNEAGSSIYAALVQAWFDNQLRDM